MEYKTIVIEKEKCVCRVFLNRPDSLNALDMGMRAELSDCIDEVANDPEIRAMILSGKGRAFCAGGDITTMQQEFQPLAGRKRLKDLHAWLKKLINLEIPVIAAVNGAAIGAGFNLALACDIVIASEKAKFCQSFLKIGLVPDSAGLYVLPRIVGLAKAKELMFTAKMIDSSEAKNLGLVNQVLPEAELLTVANSLAQELANGPTGAIGLTKRILNLSLSSDLESILELEACAQDLCFRTENFEEGKRAFFEKRKPVFK